VVTLARILFEEAPVHVAPEQVLNLVRAVEHYCREVRRVMLKQVA
jgi:hypothetical protein